MSSEDGRIARLEAQVARLLEAIAERDAKIAKLEAENAELRARLGQNSTNSHKPPSTDAPGTRPGKKPTGRARGGQPGHKRHERVMLPPEKVTKRTVVKPTVCECCGSRRLSALEQTRKHQVLEVPEPRPDVHEITMHGAECQDCGSTTWARLPDGVPRHMFGARLLATIAYLVGARMSRRQIRELLLELHGIPVSLGALSEAEERVSDAIAAPVDDAVAFARAAHVKHVDASSWRLAGALVGLWTIATKLVTVFFITADQKRETVQQVLGTLQGFLVTDRGSQFGFWAMDRRQICWAHLIRKFAAMAERDDEAGRVGQALLLLAQAVLYQWHRERGTRAGRARFRSYVQNARLAFEGQLARGVALDVRGVSGACADILAHKDALFTFAYEPGVEPTNNDAERALRPFVIWRKVSYGSQSERGCLFAQRLMTAVQTLRQQKRSVYAFLADACHAAMRGTPTPTLLPTTR